MVALDLGQPEGREVLLRLLENADVLIHNYKSGALEKWGLGYEDFLRERFPRLVYCHLTGYGPDGPLGGLPGYDSAVQATAGMMSINGPPETGPLRIAVPIVDLGMGLNAVIGILLALLHRDRTGTGQAIDASLYDAAVTLLHPQAANYLMSGDVPVATGNAHPNISPYERFETGTKPIFLAVGNDRQFRKLCELMDVPGLADDPRFIDNASRLVNRPELRAELSAVFQGRDGEQLADELIRNGVPAGAVLNVAEVLESDHAKHRGLVVEDGPYRGTGFSIKLSDTEARLRWGPRPFNADGQAVLLEAGYSEDDVQRLQSSGVLPRERRRDS
jgi:crotonobetainyl-CoA:carnitine CoA-transferase CaiB-like acyl-CoA transferase